MSTVLLRPLMGTDLPAQLSNDLSEALSASKTDPCYGLELLAQVVLASAEACAAGDAGGCIPVLHAAVAALLEFLLGLLIRLPAAGEGSSNSRSHEQQQQRARLLLARHAAGWTAVQSAMAAVYGVDDPTLATAVLRGWRSIAAALLQPRRRPRGNRRRAIRTSANGGGGGGGGSGSGFGAEAASGIWALLDDGSEEEDNDNDGSAGDGCVCLPRPPAPAITADPRVIDELLGRCLAHARALRPLGGLAARLVSLLRAFQCCCGVNACHDCDPLQLLMLWLHLLLHTPPPPPPPRPPLNAAGGGGGGGGGGGRGAVAGGSGSGAAAGVEQKQQEEEKEEEVEKRALARVCGEVYPLAAPAMQRWVASHRQQQRQQRQMEVQQRQREERQQQTEGQQAADTDADADKAAAAEGEEELLAPPVLFFQLLLAVVQDGAADGARWTPYTAAALEQTSQQIFALLGGCSETYSACWGAHLAGAEESLAAATTAGAASGGGGGGGYAAEWSADPGVSRAMDLMRSYSGLPLVVRAALARAGDNRKKVAALMSLLTAMCRPRSEAVAVAAATAAATAAAAGHPTSARTRGSDDHDGGGGAAAAVMNHGGVSYSGPHPMSRLVSLCCELLLPESNCPVEVRVAALQALCSALDEHLAFLDEQKEGQRRRRRRQEEERRRQRRRRRGDQRQRQQARRGEAGGGGDEDGDGEVNGDDDGDGGEVGEAAGGLEDGGGGDGGDGGDSGGGDGGGSGRQAALLWSAASVDALFFSLLHDPSIKVRRVAMRLVSLVVLPAGGDGAIRLARVLLMKLRDKDALVSDRALELLVQLPIALITRAVATEAEGTAHGGGPGGGGVPGRASSWAAITQHCIAGLAAAGAPAAAELAGDSGDGGGGAAAAAAAGGGALSGRAQNCRKLLQAALGAAAAAAAAGYAGAELPHPLELLLLPALLAPGGEDALASGGAVSALRRAEAALATAGPPDEA
ncbi:hypothetical protein PLESTM_000439400 [Pleodorina starrii]|nr:hypothetical protein PLESTM_000439400 [Pleodorina starrii]